MGKAFKAYAGPRALLISSLTVIGFLLGLYLVSGISVLTGSLISLVASLLFSFSFSTWLTRKLGGLSGDMYGAVAELSEVVVLIGFVMSTYIR